jgi:putative addiction module component (TIGR02574 family)
MSNTLEQIQQLPVAEQLRLVEQIWEGIHDTSKLVREWHREEVNRRVAELDADESIAITRAELWKRVDDPNA